MKLENNLGKIFLCLILISMMVSFAYATSIVDDTQAEFNQGTYSNTEWDTNHVQLSSGQTSGTYTSQVFDASSTVEWKNISWTANGFGELPSDMQDNVLLFHLDESSGTIIDSSVEGNDGSYNGALYSQTGQINDAIGFDNSNDILTVTDDDSLDFGTSDFTIEFWINRDGSGTDGIIDKANPTGHISSSAGYDLHFAGGNNMRFRCMGDAINKLSTATITNSEGWTHVAVVADRDGNLVFYKNGVAGGSSSISSQSSLNITSTYDFRVGVVRGSSNYYFDGEMDEIAIYKRALSQSEVQDHYERGIIKLDLEARTCDDYVCSGESYTDITDVSPQDLSLSDNRYFQYKYDFTGDSSSSPEIYDVTIVHTGSGNVTPENDTTAPTVSLDSPADSASFTLTNNVTISLSATDNIELESCTLYNDISGSWESDTMKTVSGTSDSEIWNKNNLDNGTYSWNAYCCDNSSNCDWSDSNYTFSVAFPIGIEPETNETGNTTIDFVNPTPTDDEVINSDSVVINVSIDSYDLVEAKLNWDGTEYTMYDDSLVLMMNFDGSSAIGENNSYTVDISNQENDGSLIGDSVYSTDSKYGKSIYLDGTGDRVDVVADTSLDFELSDFSVEFWVKRLDSGTHGIMSKGDYDGQGYSLFFTGGNTIRTRAANDDIDTSSTLGETITAADGWTHIVVSYDRDGNMVIYKDADVSYTESIAGAASSNITSTQDFRLGYIENVGGSSYYSNAYFDGLRIYKRVLSQNEVSEHYNANMYKYDLDKFALTLNKQGLGNGSYDYLASAEDSLSLVSTETRTLNVNLTQGNQSNQTNQTTGTISITYPGQYVIVQRDSNDKGVILIEGTYTGTPAAIEARLAGSSWKTIVTSPTGGSFEGNLTNQSVGQGVLEVRFTDGIAVTDSVNNIGVGDVYAIAGQSNAEMRGYSMQYLNTSNAYNATVYREDNAWKIADDKVDTGTSVGSCWPLLADHIIQNENIPVAYVSTARGGTALATWLKGGSDYNNLVNQVTEATHGTMNIKAVLFFQGERDSSTSPPGCVGNYTCYYNGLSSFAADITADTNAENVIVGQVHYQPSGSRDSNDNIRKAQQDLWDDDSLILAGPVTYEMGPLPDNLHFKTNAELAEIGEKWWTALEEHYYNGNNGRGPIIQNASFNSGSNVLTLTFDKNLNSGSGSEGWMIVDGGTTLTDSNILNSSVSGSVLELTLDTSISENAEVSLGSRNDGIGNNVPEGTDEFNLPAEMIFSFPLGGIVCEESLVNTTWSSWTNVSSCLLNDTVEQERSLVQYDENECGATNVTYYEYQTTGCDYCTPDMMNTTWSSWTNVSSCLLNDTVEQERSLVQYDSNVCGEVGNTTYYEYQDVGCDYCVPEMINETGTWEDIECLTGDVMNQSRDIVEYDSNVCGEVSNTTYTEYRATEYCDYCTPDMMNTTWSDWYNTSSCYINDTIEQERSLVEYDSNVCGEVGNTTYYEYQTGSCDYCVPEMINTTWTEWTNISCLSDNTMNQTRELTQYDQNYCGEVGNQTFVEYRATESCEYYIIATFNITRQVYNDYLAYVAANSLNVDQEIEAFMVSEIES